MQLNLANLLTAMLIMGILAAVLVPSATGTGATLAVEAAGEQLARELQAVRQQAVAQNATFEVVFQRHPPAYLIKEAELFVPAPPRIYLPPGVDWVRLPFERLIFYGTGRCSQAGTISLGHGESNLKFQIIIAPRTGRIRVNREQH